MMARNNDADFAKSRSVTPVTGIIAVTAYLGARGFAFRGWRTAMANIVAQTHRLSAFFGSIAQRFYDARLTTAEREVNRHRQFLGK
jgi:hypothetical protein